MYSSANLGLHRRRIKKEICKVFAHNKLKITIEANKKIVNFLDALRYSRNRSVVRCHCCEFLLDIYIYITNGFDCCWKWQPLFQLATAVYTKRKLASATCWEWTDFRAISTINYVQSLCEHKTCIRPGSNVELHMYRI